MKIGSQSRKAIAALLALLLTLSLIPGIALAEALGEGAESAEQTEVVEATPEETVEDPVLDTEDPIVDSEPTTPEEVADVVEPSAETDEALSAFGAAAAAEEITTFSSSARITRFELREGSASGQFVADLLSGESPKWDVNKMYYLVVDVTKTSTDDSWVSIDIPYWMEPISMIGGDAWNIAGTVVDDTAIENVVDFTAQTYTGSGAVGDGSPAAVYSAGKVTYHFKSGVETGQIAVSLKPKFRYFNGNSSGQAMKEPLTVACGDMNGTFAGTQTDAKNATITVMPAHEDDTAVHFYNTGVVPTYSPGELTGVNTQIYNGRVGTEGLALWTQLEFDITWSKYVFGDPAINFAGVYVFDTSKAVENPDGSKTLHCSIANTKGSDIYSALNIEAVYESGTPSGEYLYEITNSKITTYGDPTGHERTQVSTYKIPLNIADGLQIDFDEFGPVKRYDWYGQKNISQNSLINAVDLRATGSSTKTSNSFTVRAQSPSNAIIRTIVVPRYEGSGSTISITAGGFTRDYDISEVNVLGNSEFAVIRNTDLNLGKEVSIDGFTYTIGKIKGGTSTVVPLADKYEVYDYYRLSLWGSFAEGTTATGSFVVYDTELGESADTAKKTASPAGVPLTDLIISGQNTSAVQLTFGDAQASNVTLTAGQTTKVTATYLPTAYTFYSNATSVFDYEPTFYLQLPKGLNYSNFAIGGVPVEGVMIPSDEAAADGLSLYKFTSPKGTQVGYYLADGSGAKALELSFDLAIERSAKTKTHDFSEILFVGNATISDAESSSGSNSIAAADTYGINNGNELRTWAPGTSFLNVREVKEVIIENSMTVTRKGVTQKVVYDANDAANTRALLDEETTASYAVTITNRTGDVATDIEAFIPIPKTDKTYGAAFNPDGAFEFDSSFKDVTVPRGFDYELIKFNSENATYGVGSTPSADQYSVVSDASQADMVRIYAVSMETDAQATITLDVDLGSNLNASAGKVNAWNIASRFVASGTSKIPLGTPQAVEVAVGAINGKVYLDTDGSGTLNGTEAGVSGVTVTATDSFGKIMTAITDAQGDYGFTSVRNATGVLGTINHTTNVTVVIANPDGTTYTFSPTTTAGTKPSNVTAESDEASASLVVTCPTTTAVEVNAGLRSSHTITYVAGANGTIGAPANEVVLGGGSPATIPNVTPQNNSVFTGWSLSAAVKATAVVTVGETTYNAGDSIPAGSLLTSEQLATIVVLQDLTATANFKLKIFTLTFNANGGNTGTVANKQVTMGLEVGELPSTAEGTAPTRAGYTFAGWATVASATTADFTASTIWAADDDGTVYAVWTANTNTEYKVEHYKVDSTGSATLAQTDSGLSGTTGALATAIPKTFTGFDYDENYTGSLVSDYITGDGQLTLKLYYVVQAYTVNYVANGGTGSVDSQSVYYGEAWKTRANGFTRAGYTFAGWNTQADGTGVGYGANTDYTSYDDTKGMTLYARWTVNDGTSYTVIHYLVSTTGTITVGTTENLTGATDTTAAASERAHTGYTFAPEYEGTKTSGTITGDGSLVLKLFYMQNTYTVTFVDYDSSVLATRTGVPYGGDALAPTTPPRSGYTFAGWDRSYTNVTSNLVVTATYTPQTFTLTFNANGGNTGTVPNKTVTMDVAVGELPSTAEGTAPTRAGYTFAGWATSQTATVADFTESTVWATAADGTVYAVWTANGNTAYKVEHYKVDSVGSAVLAQTDSGLTGTTGTLATAVPQTFTGYTIDDSFTGTLASDYITGDGLLTLKLYYVVQSYTVSYEANNGTGTVDPQTVYYGEAWKTRANGFTRAGYTFVGWNTQADGKGTSYDANADYASYDDTKGMTLYARWTANTGTAYKVEHYLVSAAGAITLDTTENLTGTTDQTATAAQRAYVGYTYAPNYTGTKTSGVIDGNGNLALKLYYTQNTYTVTFVDYNGSVLATRAGIPHGGDALAPANPSRIGHTFAGWDRGYTNVTANLRVTATYTPLSYTITFVDYDGAEIQSSTATYGSSVTPPANPSRQGFRFTGWDKDASTWTTVTANATVRAMYDDETTVTPPATGTTTTPRSSGSQTSTTTTTQSFSQAAEEQGIPSIGVPLSAPAGFDAWALANLILVVLGILMTLIFAAIRAVRKEDKNEYKERRAQNGEVTRVKQRRNIAWLVVTALLAVAGLVLFVLTQDISLPMVWMDFWTIFNAIIFVAVLVVGNVAILRKKETNQEDETATQTA